MRRGFTLIELLVVIAIIAILAAILFPVFLSAKQKAFVSQCMAHGREIGQAMLMYLDDNNDRFPSQATQEMMDKFKNYTWTYDWPYSPGVETWGIHYVNEFKFIQLAKYVKNENIWICPSPSGPYGTRYAYGFRCSWLFLRNKLGYGQDFITYPDTPMCKPDHPSQGRLIGRTVNEVLANDRTQYGRATTPSKKIWALCYGLGPDIPVEAYPGGPIITPYYPHQDGSIYVYLDGHARWHEMGCGWAPVGYTNHRMDRPHRH